jgi:regulator of CtrA degradation
LFGSSPGSGSVQSKLAVFTRTYDETLDMIVEARDYVVHLRPRGRRGATPTSDLRVSCEALRVTSRLTQVMAWLMLQRAVCQGEITELEACQERNRLSGRSVCLDAAANDDELPPGLKSLLRRSLHLYQRISRLEEMVIARVLH